MKKDGHHSSVVAWLLAMACFAVVGVAGFAMYHAAAERERMYGGVDYQASAFGLFCWWGWISESAGALSW
jgi:hypothetical protein